MEHLGHGNAFPQLQMLQSLVDFTDNNRILFCVPESAGDIFLSTSLLPSVKENYPNFDIYFACKREYEDILKGNPYIYKVFTVPLNYGECRSDGRVV